MTKEDTERLLEDICGKMLPGGRFCYLTMLEPNKFPAETTMEKLVYLKELSAELHERSLLFLYSGFHVFEMKQ